MSRHILDSSVITEAFPHEGDCGGTICSACGCCGHCAPGHCGGTVVCDDEGCGCLDLIDPTPGQPVLPPVTANRLEVATDAAARKAYENATQGDDGIPVAWDDLDPVDKLTLRELVLPIVTAALAAIGAL